MGRLIDADDVIQTLKETGIIQDNDLGHLVVDEINRIPTAYDVEKVAHELREATKCNIDCYEGRASEVADYDDSWNDDIISACKALEIVGKGGVE